MRRGLADAASALILLTISCRTGKEEPEVGPSTSSRAMISGILITLRTARDSLLSRPSYAVCVRTTSPPVFTVLKNRSMLASTTNRSLESGAAIGVAARVGLEGDNVPMSPVPHTTLYWPALVS